MLGAEVGVASCQDPLCQGPRLQEVGESQDSPGWRLPGVPRCCVRARPSRQSPGPRPKGLQGLPLPALLATCQAEPDALASLLYVLWVAAGGLRELAQGLPEGGVLPFLASDLSASSSREPWALHERTPNSWPA